MKTEETQEQELRDCCIRCGAMGEWCYDEGTVLMSDGSETDVHRFYRCGECGKSWAEKST